VVRKRILVAEDDSGVAFGLESFLETNGFEVVVADSCKAALQAAESARPDVAILDYQLPDGDALTMLPRLKSLAPEVSVIVLTGHGSIELAVRSIKEGADHFVTKPVELGTLLVLVQRVLDHQRLEKKQSAGQRRQARATLDPFLGQSDAIKRAQDDARLTLQTDRPILIEGETGTGKGVLAAWLHRSGSRAEEAFVDLNCAGLSRELLDSELFGHERGAFTGAVGAKNGLFEVAHRGTLFLDELGDMDLDVQSKLLKVLEERRFRRVGDVRDREVDVQLIAATHRQLEELVRRKRFREDLFYRVNVLSVRMPPLRERVADIRLLAEDMLVRLAAETGRARLELTPEAIATLESYRWPGNLRELRNVIEQAVLRCEGWSIEPRHLRLELAEKTGTENESDLTLAELERLHIERALEREGGHVERASRRLGVPRSTLYQKLKTMGIPLHR
jgi:DNA-binding NtrC family response regulator